MIACFECGKPAEHDHHVVPVVRGGTRTVPLCSECVTVNELASHFGVHLMVG